MRLFKFVLPVLCLLLAATAAQAGDYQYMPAEALKAKIESHAPVHIFDIQVADEFAEHHLPGAMKSTAYPVKSAEDKAKIDPFLKSLTADDAPVAIVCPRGAGGAKRAYDYLQEQGVASTRLFILTDGQAGWPYPELTQKGQ